MYYYARTAFIGGEEAVGQVNPPHNVLPVLPSHLYVGAFTKAVSVQVGQQDVVTHVGIYLRYGQHTGVTVLITVNKHRRTAGRAVGAGVHCVVAFAVGHYNKGVAQGLHRLHAVNPVAHVRVFGVHQ